MITNFIQKKKFKNNIAWSAEGVWETINKEDAKGGPFGLIYFTMKFTI